MTNEPGFLELVYGVLFEPAPTFRNLVRATDHRAGLGKAFLLLTLVLLANQIMAFSITAGRLLPNFGPHAALAFRQGMGFFVLAGLLWRYLEWVVFTAVYHLTAEFLGGAGRAGNLLVLTALSRLPAIFLVPLELLLFLPALPPGLTVLFLLFAALVLFLWSIYLMVLALRENYLLGTGRAIAVLLLPPVALGGAGVLFLLGSFMALSLT